MAVHEQCSPWERRPSYRTKRRVQLHVVLESSQKTPRQADVNAKGGHGYGSGVYGRCATSDLSKPQNILFKGGGRDGGLALSEWEIAPGSGEWWGSRELPPVGGGGGEEGAPMIWGGRLSVRKQRPISFEPATMSAFGWHDTPAPLLADHRPPLGGTPGTSSLL